MPRARVVLVTGASSGIGQACVEHLALYGYKVYGASRSSQTFPLDVADSHSVDASIAEILRQEGRLDAVVNNAGITIAGAIEETSPEEALRLFETNLFGALRVIRAALPAMREQKFGRIVNIGSIGGLLAIPFQGIYSSSKFALEGLTEALRLELKPFGISATLVEPGDHRTAITRNRVWAAGAAPDSAYHARRNRAVDVMAKDEQSGPPPVCVARVVRKVLESRHPRLRYTTGPAIQRAAVLLKRIAPYAAIERVMDIYYS